MSTATHYRIGSNYLGLFIDCVPDDPNAVECPVPINAWDTWNEQAGVWVEVPLVPQSITRRQARLALLSAGKLTAVESAIAALADPAQQMAAQIEYENATWERANPWVDQLGAQAGLSPADIDQLFISAASL